MKLRQGVLVQLLPETKISALGHKYSLIVLKPLNVPIKTKEKLRMRLLQVNKKFKSCDGEVDQMVEPSVGSFCKSLENTTK